MAARSVGSVCRCRPSLSGSIPCSLYSLQASVLAVSTHGGLYLICLSGWRRTWDGRRRITWINCAKNGSRLTCPSSSKFFLNTYLYSIYCCRVGLALMSMDGEEVTCPLLPAFLQQQQFSNAFNTFTFFIRTATQLRG